MWTVHIRVPIFLTVCLFIFVVLAGSAVRAQQPCTVTPVPRIRTGALIFSIQQERILGDIEAELVEGNYPVVHDDGLASHLNTVARRILAQFPPDQARVHVILIDTPEAESFSVGPERIYVARKMITLLKNDDELAGLLGHELGHILMHQNGIIVGQLFHEILGVNAVSDRKDISDKPFAQIGSPFSPGCALTGLFQPSAFLRHTAPRAPEFYTVGLDANKLRASASHRHAGWHDWRHFRDAKCLGVMTRRKTPWRPWERPFPRR